MATADFNNFASDVFSASAFVQRTRATIPLLEGIMNKEVIKHVVLEQMGHREEALLHAGGP